MPQISLEEHRSRGAQNVRRAQKTPSQVGILIKSERDSVIARYVPPGKEVKWSKLKHLSKKTLLWDRSHNLLLALVVQYSHGCYYRYPCCRFINFQSSVPVCHAGDAVKILKFSDDTKLFFTKIKDQWEKQQLQDDIENWSKGKNIVIHFLWLCKCLHRAWKHHHELRNGRHDST